MTNGNGVFSTVSWSPNGEKLGFIGRETDTNSVSKIWIYSLENNNLACLTSELDLEIGDVAFTEFHVGTINNGLMWTLDSEGFYRFPTEDSLFNRVKSLSSAIRGR